MKKEKRISQKIIIIIIGRRRRRRRRIRVGGKNWSVTGMIFHLSLTGFHGPVANWQSGPLSHRVDFLSIGRRKLSRDTFRVRCGLTAYLLLLAKQISACPLILHLFFFKFHFTYLLILILILYFYTILTILLLYTILILYLYTYTYLL